MPNIRVQQLPSLRFMPSPPPRPSSWPLPPPSRAIDCRTEGSDWSWPSDYMCVESNYLQPPPLASFHLSSLSPKNTARPIRQDSVMFFNRVYLLWCVYLFGSAVISSACWTRVCACVCLCVCVCSQVFLGAQPCAALCSDSWMWSPQETGSIIQLGNLYLGVQLAEQYPSLHPF